MPVYYSVGTSTSDLKTDGPTISISNDTAIFSTAQTGAIGIGDVITYDTDDKKAYIKGKISNTQWNVSTATGTTPSGVTNKTVTSITRAFHSLGAAVNGPSPGAANSSHLNTKNLVSNNYLLVIACYADGVDTSMTTVDYSWTTDTAHYIKIFTPTDTTAECNANQRHNGAINGGGYTLNSPNSNSYVYNLDIDAYYTKVFGLKVIRTSANWDYGYCIGHRNYTVNSGIGCEVAYNLLYESSGGGNGGVLSWSNVSWTSGYGLNCHDNIIVSGSSTAKYGLSLYAGYQNDAAHRIKAYNNTVYGTFISSGGAFRIYVHNSSGSSYLPLIRNNYAVCTGNGPDYLLPDSSNLNNTLSAFAYNASDDNTAGTSNNNKTISAANMQFVSTTSGSQDLHIQSSSSARGQGIGPSDDANVPTKDIDGETRAGSTSDIGADKYVTTSGYQVRYVSIGGREDDEAGLVSVDSGSTIVTGTSTTWMANNRGRGDSLIINDVSYTVDSVTSDTRIVLTKPATAAASGASYVLKRKYATFSAWENQDKDLVSENQSEVVYLYNDGASFTSQFVEDWTTDSTHTITITAQGINRHNGTAGTGVIMDCDSAFWRLTPGNIIVENLEIIRMYMVGVFINGDNTAIRNCIIHNSVSGSGNYGIYVEYGKNNARVYNNIVYDVTADGIRSDVESGSVMPIIANNTVFNCGGHGICVASGDNIIINNICMGNDWDFYEVSSSGIGDNDTNNICGDASLNIIGNGAKNHYNATFPSLAFMDTALSSCDLHVHSYSVAKDAGSDLSAFFTTDIDDVVRSGAWDIGADEYTGPGEIVLSAHPEGQEANAFTGKGSETNAELFAFKLYSVDNPSITRLVFDLSGVQGLTASDWAGVELAVDADSSGTIDAGETSTVGGAGVVDLDSATITFSTSFSVGATMYLILRADFATLSHNDAVSILLNSDSIITTADLSGTVQSTRHHEWRPSAITKSMTRYNDKAQIDYLIITKNDVNMIHEFERLAIYKQAKGMKVKIVTVDSIKTLFEGSDTQEKIRKYIQYAKQEYKITWVLLGGDYTIIPARYLYSSMNGGSAILSDMYYACLESDFNLDKDNHIGEVTDDVDIFPDVVLGRMPCSDWNEARKMIDKSLEYEHKGLVGTGERKIFLSGIDMLGKRYSPQDSSYIDDGTYYNHRILKDIIHEGFPSYTDEDFTEIYEDSIAPGDSVIDDTIEVSLNSFLTRLFGNPDSSMSPANLWVHYGHGAEEGLIYNSGDVLTTHLLKLNSNPQKNKNTGHSLIIGCGTITPNSASFAKKMLTYYEGSNTYYAASNWDYPSTSLNIHIAYLKALFQDTVMSAGLAATLSKLDENAASGADQFDFSKRWLLFAYNFLGDPELPLWKDTLSESTRLNISNIGSLALVKGSQICTLDVDAGSSSADEGTMVTMFQNNNNMVRGQVDGAGKVILNFTGLADVQAAVYIGVTHPKYAPNMYRIDDIAAAGNPYLFVTTEATRDSSQTSSDTLSFSFGVKNSGPTTAFGALTIISLIDSSDTSFVTIIDGVDSIGSIAPDNQDDFSYMLSINRSIQTHRVILFNVAMYCDGGFEFNNRFALDVGEKKLSLSKGTASGNGTSRSAQYTLKNVGTHGVTGATLYLQKEADDSAIVSISPSSRTVTSMAPDSEKTASAFTVTLDTNYSYQTSALTLIVSYDGISDTQIVDVTAPDSIPALVAVSYGPGKIYLEWSKPASADIAGYHLYRKHADSTSFTQVNGLICNSFYLDDDSAALKSGNTFIYYVKAYDHSMYESDSIFDTVTTELPMKSGYPIDLENGHGASPKIADLDNDGDKEMVFPLASSEVKAYHHDGQEYLQIYENDGYLFSFKSNNYTINHQIGLGDVTGDGKRDAVIAAGDTVYVNQTTASPTAMLKKGIEQYVAPWAGKHQSFNVSAPIVYDFDGNGRDEIVVNCWLGKAFILWYDGTFNIDSTENAYQFSRPMSLGDVYGDNTKELVAPVRVGNHIHFFHGGTDGFTNHDSLRWKMEDKDTKVEDAISLADLNHDGKDELVFFYSHGGGAGVSVCAIRVDTVAGSDSLAIKDTLFDIILDLGATPTLTFDNPVVGDVDGNGDYEVVWNYGDTLYVAFLTYNGHLDTLVSRNVNKNSYNLVSSPYFPLLADINNDSKADILFATKDGWIYCYEGGDYRTSDPRLMDGFPLRISPSGLYEKTGFAIDDIDDDGKYEIVDNSGDGFCRVWETEGYVNGTMQWLQRSHDARNTNSASFNEGPGVQNNSTLKGRVLGLDYGIRITETAAPKYRDSVSIDNFSIYCGEQLYSRELPYDRSLLYAHLSGLRNFFYADSALGGSKYFALFNHKNTQEWADYSLAAPSYSNTVAAVNLSGIEVQNGCDSCAGITFYNSIPDDETSYYLLLKDGSSVHLSGMYNGVPISLIPLEGTDLTAGINTTGLTNYSITVKTYPDSTKIIIRTDKDSEGEIVPDSIIATDVSTNHLTKGAAGYYFSRGNAVTKRIFKGFAAQKIVEEPKTFFVSITGDDADDGEYTSPFRTLQKAYGELPDTLEEPWTIYLMPGVHDSIDCIYSDREILFADSSKHFTKTNKLIIKSYYNNPDSQATLYIDTAHMRDDGKSQLITLANHNITIEGIKFKGCLGGKTKINGIGYDQFDRAPTGQIHNLTIKNCYFEMDSLAIGVDYDLSSDSLNVINCIFKGNDSSATTGAIGINDSGESQARGNHIINSTFHDLGKAIAVAFDSVSIINTIFSNCAYAYFGYASADKAVFKNVLFSDVTTLVETGTGYFHDTLKSNPAFMSLSESSYDFMRPYAYSPCKNAGARDTGSLEGLIPAYDYTYAHRGYATDIGAVEASEIRGDEANTHMVIYSVGQNTDDHKTSSPTVSINNGVATFSTAQTSDYLGAGDRLTYDGLKKCYLKEKISSTKWKVVSAHGMWPLNIVSKTVNSITHCFPSLDSAINGDPGTTGVYALLGDSVLTAAGSDILVKLACYDDGSDDTSMVVISSGWATDSMRYIVIFAPSDTLMECNKSQRHDGSVDGNGYTMKSSIGGDYRNNIHVIANYTKIDGVKVIRTSENWKYGFAIGVRCAYMYTCNYLEVRNCLLIQESGGQYGSLLNVSCISATNNYGCYFHDNMIVSQSDSLKYGIHVEGGYQTAAARQSKLYNNTVYGKFVVAGFSVDIDNSYGSSYMPKIKNNYVCDIKVDGLDYEFGGNYYNSLSVFDYNAADDGSAGTNNSNQTILVDSCNFVSTTSGLEDLHIQNGSGLLDQGIGPVLDPIVSEKDIDGTKRSGNISEIGVDEL